jgi:hypothetical protein
MTIIAHLFRSTIRYVTGDQIGYTRSRLILAGQPMGGGKKKKAKRFRAVEAVKALARERIGTPPAAKVVLEKKKKPEKHKPTLGKLLAEE